MVDNIIPGKILGISTQIPTQMNSKEKISILSWCSLRLYMISQGFSEEAIQVEKDKYIVVDNRPHTPQVKFVLNGDMANEFNDSHPSDEYDYEDDEYPLGI